VLIAMLHRLNVLVFYKEATREIHCHFIQFSLHVASMF
jgi:hypothetical protein